MKKIVLAILVGMFVCSGLSAAVQPDMNTTHTVTRSFSAPTQLPENAYVNIAFDEANGYLMEQGKPMIPSYTETFTYPFGTVITDVTVTPSSLQAQSVNRLVAPTPPMAVAGSLLGTEQTVSYGADPYPETWYTYRVGCGRVGADLSVIVTVEVYPVKYFPATGTLQWTPSADISIDFTPTEPRPANRETYQFVIIAPSEYSSQIAPLVTHKIGQGVTTKFVSMTDITSGTYFPAQGRDDAEKVKYFIKNAIETWTTRSVMLVGGSTKLPVRETHVYIADDPTYGDEIFVSDLYFADIYNATGAFCSWDSNGNNIFGEFDWLGQTDVVDLHPDVYLARIPVTSSSQVTTSVNKFIGYETTPGYLQSWFPNLVVCGGDSFDDTNKVDEGEYSNQKVIDLLVSFIPNKLWCSNGKLTSLAPTGVANIVSAINAGCGFVDFSGHGNTNIWATHPHDSGSWVPTPAGGIRTNDIAGLSNGNKLPIVTVEACSTAKFASDLNCFNWAFVYNPSGGAIGTFGATGIGYSYIGTGVSQGLVGKIGLDTYRAYKTDGATSFGELWGRALNRYIKSSMTDADYKTVEEWQSMGDPTLAIAEDSQPPAKPATPSGPASGKVGTAYTYTTSTTDPEGDKISYMFDWGDGTTSGWIGPYNSGSVASTQKTWTAKGDFSVKVVARDAHGIMSVWSDPLPISMPLDYTPDLPLLHFLQLLLERFPNAFPILRALLA